MKSERHVVTLSASGMIELPPPLLDALGWRPPLTLHATVSGERCTFEPAPLSVSRAEPTESSYAVGRKNLETPLRYIRGVGPVLSRLLEKKGIRTVEDALYLLPHRYEDRRGITPVCALSPGFSSVFQGEVIRAGSVATRGGRRLFEAVVRDETGAVTCKWFNSGGDYLKKSWRVGRRGIFSGTPSRFGVEIEVHHPDVEWLGDGEAVSDVMKRDPVNFGRLVPVYPLTEGLHQKTLRKVMREIVSRFAPSLPSLIPPDLMAAQGLMPLSDAVALLHFPEEPQQHEPGGAPVSTVIFDELFFLELGIAMRRKGVELEPGISFAVNHVLTRPLIQMLPFSLTPAQRRVLSEIKRDMMSPHPMHRLIQGDVGCGKTVVALLAALIAVENGYQVAIMAPTEILAEQHFLNIHSYCDRLGIGTALLTSGVRGVVREKLLDDIAAGAVSIVIGTHAVIQAKVEFARLGLGIIDEQHRFGVVQRAALKRKGIRPDILVMTATPIPRTLAMTVYGDLALSVIDELPPGRKPVETRVFREEHRHHAFRMIRDEIGRGRQAYIICPLVDESEKVELTAAVTHVENLIEVFPGLRLGLLHGRMKPEEKEMVMRRLKEREIDILVSTTVIEVGIDVPNATVIMIEHAERFGLSQLHQLRGRVGRGGDRSYCFLIASSSISEEGMKRLRVMERHGDGFSIAEADLEMRGPGDFLGTRQSGMPDLRVASIIRDARLLEAARTAAFAIAERDPELILPEHRLLRKELFRRWEGRLEPAGIG